MTQPTAAPGPAFAPSPTLLVIVRFDVEPTARAAFDAAASAALAVLAAQPGCRAAAVGQSTDEPDRVVLRTEWDTVGAYRRALGSYEAKVTVVPLLSQALDESSAYELTLVAGPDGATSFRSGLAADFGDVRLGEAAAAHVAAVGDGADR